MENVTEQSKKEELISFFGDTNLKAKYLAQIKEHAKADDFVQSEYWNDGKEDPIECLLHSDLYIHIESKLGLPLWLVYLVKRLFENISYDEAKRFAIEWFEAVPVGKNLERVKWKFLIFILERNIQQVSLLTVKDNKIKDEVIKANELVKDVYVDALKTNHVNLFALGVASSAVQSAILSLVASYAAAQSQETAHAEYVLDAATRSANAAVFATYLHELKEITDSAAWVAKSTTWADSGRADDLPGYVKYQLLADKLIELLKEVGE